jgi:hypothetical protein
LNSAVRTLLGVRETCTDVVREEVKNTAAIEI